MRHLWPILLISGCGKPMRSPVRWPWEPQVAPESTNGLADIISSLPNVFGVLIVVFVGGIIFSVMTKSKQGWVIPVAAVAGMVLVVAFAAYAKLIGLLALVGCIGLLVWKARQYQRERNEHKLEGE